MNINYLLKKVEQIHLASGKTFGYFCICDKATCQNSTPTALIRFIQTGFINPKHICLSHHLSFPMSMRELVNLNKS